MQKRKRGAAIAMVAAAAMVMAATGQASAEVPSEQAAEVAATAAAVDAATNAVDGASGTDAVTSQPGSGDSAAVAETAAGTVDIPASSDGQISIGDGAGSVQISLPDVVNATGELDPSGETVVYSDPEEPADLAVQATERGARALVTIKDASAPHRYAFGVDGPEGSRLVSSAEFLGAEYDTGEVLLFAADGTTLLGTFDAPWATDAHGAPVPTHYEVTDGEVVQVVDFTADTAFPVVADPSFWEIAKCVAAITWLIGSNIVIVAKLIKIKKYIAALGGIRRSAELMIRASTWEERLRIGGGALVGLASEVLGISAVRNNC